MSELVWLLNCHNNAAIVPPAMKDTMAANEIQYSIFSSFSDS